MNFIKYLLLLIGAGVIIWWLSSSNSYSSGSNYDDYSGTYVDNEEFNEEAPITSDNWECTGDCSGHEAGYEWAAEQGISSGDDCGGNSDSFREGCEAWANEVEIEAYEDGVEYEESYDYQDYAY